LPEDEAERVANRVTDEVCKKKKDVEKAKKEARECAKLQRRTHRQGSDKEAVEDDDNNDDDDVDEEED
jgi:hypothetical protein